MQACKSATAWPPSGGRKSAPAWRKIAPAWRKSATAWPPSGARAVRYFEVCHFVEGPFKADDEAREKLRQHCVGLPVFSPDPGYGWSHEWARHVVDELACFPSLVDDILDGRIECRGQRLTDLAPFKVPPYAGAVVTKEHLFEDVEDAIKSYECCWLRSADFPEKKPSWARITDEE